MKQHAKSLLVLIALLILLGLGGLGGGIAMFFDPSGTAMGLPADLLDELPISNFILPGVFLVVIMGLVPFLWAWGLWQRAAWGWYGTLAQSILLIAWILFQLLLWGDPIVIQWMYLLWGLAMLGLCFAPAVKAIPK
ncbi:MAG: hypothetical protein JW862_05255 [Anaerolineales bacterium]|nr:hypothetical protein [Anaerolineales bacterium]